MHQVPGQVPPKSLRGLAWSMCLVLVLAAVASCSSKQPAVDPLQPSSEPVERSEFFEEDLGEFSTGPVRVPELKTIYFDYDRYSVRPDQIPVARNNALEIDRHPEWRQVVVEGHTDERGTEEYNLALGDRRANAVADVYIRSGVPASRIVTVSFGASRPAVQGHDESAWRYNRRVDTLVNQ